MGTLLETINITTKQNTAFSTTIVPPAGYKLGHIHIVDNAGVESEIDVPTAQELSYLLSLPLPPQKIDVCVFKAASFENFVWYMNSRFTPNVNLQLPAFVENQVGTDTAGRFDGGYLRYSGTSNNLKLKTGNAEAIIEFYYASNTTNIGSGAIGDRLSTVVQFASNNSCFGICRSNHCFSQAAMHQVNMAGNTTLVDYGNDYYTVAFNCKNPPLTHYAGMPNQINVPYIDGSRMGQTYPKTKFKMRMANGIYELYKNDILVGSTPYDNTVEYNFQLQHSNAYNPSTPLNLALQLIKIEGNFE